MKVLIIEDEPHAATRLQKVLEQVDASIEVVDKIDSVKSAVIWFTSHPAPELIFMDIQLGDGLSFSIFEQVNIDCPVVFTTAYDEYALKAFKVNSIDYILKPVDPDDIRVTLEKLKRLSVSKQDTSFMLGNIQNALQSLTRKTKSRFVVKIGEHLKTIAIEDILYFYSQDKATFCFTNEKRNVILDYTLDEIQELVDHERFFRINRKYLISENAFTDIVTHLNSRLKLTLKGSDDRDIVVSRERVQEFKLWLDR
jgi:DNA-binding LytR/AlgR family response regulator